jgi:hypothetical protein
MKTLPIKAEEEKSVLGISILLTIIGECAHRRSRQRSRVKGKNLKVGGPNGMKNTRRRLSHEIVDIFLINEHNIMNGNEHSSYNDEVNVICQKVSRKCLDCINLAAFITLQYF